jgi:hypothetical protein
LIPCHFVDIFSVKNNHVTADGERVKECCAVSGQVGTLACTTNLPSGQVARLERTTNLSDSQLEG